MKNDLHKMRIMRIIKKGGRKMKFREVIKYWKTMGGCKRPSEARTINIHIPVDRGRLPFPVTEVIWIKER